jgi:uncharacterized protein YjbI with pentapeptide repeats
MLGAVLSDVNFRGAALSYANLLGARGITQKDLEAQVESIEGATMPDGSKHP